MYTAIFGGAGFIGSWVADELEARGHEVLIVDHRKTNHHTDRDVFLADIRDATAVNEVVAHVDGVIHLAAVLGTQETIQNPLPAAETNLLGSLNILQSCAQHSAPCVYAGVGNHAFREVGGGTYTITKTAVEDFIKMYNLYREGSAFSVVRPVNAYGPRQSIAAPFGTSRVRKIMPSFICRALTGTDVELYGGGVQTSDCIYVGDVAKAFVSCLEKTAKDGALETAIEIGPKESKTVREVAELVINTVELRGGPTSEIVSLPMRPGEIPNSVIASDWTTLDQVGIDADHLVSLEVGVSKTVAWFEENWLPGYLESRKA